MLNLTKWYLDLVTPEGTALIAYAARLRWKALRVEFASTFVSPAQGEPVEASAWSGVRLPEADPSAANAGPGEAGEEPLRFAHEGLGIDGRWEPIAPPVAATLFDDAAGQVRWECLQPAARASVRTPDGVLEGLGYVERLSFTRPPWSLPLRTLHWGRYVSNHHALVWIQWGDAPHTAPPTAGTAPSDPPSSGDHSPTRWVWLDGVPQEGATVGDDRLAGLAGGAELSLGPGRVLCDRKALQVLSRQLPALDALPMGRLRRLRETKRLDRGCLRNLPDGTDEGWALHEVVTW